MDKTETVSGWTVCSRRPTLDRQEEDARRRQIAALLYEIFRRTG